MVLSCQFFCCFISFSCCDFDSSVCVCQRQEAWLFLSCDWYLACYESFFFAAAMFLGFVPLSPVSYFAYVFCSQREERGFWLVSHDTWADAQVRQRRLRWNSAHWVMLPGSLNVWRSLKFLQQVALMFL